MPLPNNPGQFLRTKTATPVTAVPATPAVEGQLQNIRHDVGSQLAAEWLTKAMLGGAGLGMAARGGAGLLNQIRRVTNPIKAPARQTEFQLPYPVEEEKSAQEQAGQPVPTSYVTGNPLFLPALMAGTGLATVGGYKAMDYGLDLLRRRGIDEDTERAKQRFEQAMLGQYAKPFRATPAKAPKAKPAAAPAVRKIASADARLDPELDAALDRLYDETSKRAGVTMDDFRRWAGTGAGMYGMYGLGVGVPAAMIGYNLGSKRQTGDLLRKAINERQLAREQQSPPPLYAIPTPVTQTPTGVAPVEDEEPV